MELNETVELMLSVDFRDLILSIRFLFEEFRELS